MGWTPAIHDQAEDRTHRIGQTNSVNAHYAVGRDTIDGEIYSLIERKREVVSAASDGKDVGAVNIMRELIDGLTK
jgi:SNF2 family DNA or RNA helicase